MAEQEVRQPSLTELEEVLGRINNEMKRASGEVVDANMLDAGNREVIDGAFGRLRVLQLVRFGLELGMRGTTAVFEAPSLDGSGSETVEFGIKEAPQQRDLVRPANPLTWTPNPGITG